MTARFLVKLLRLMLWIIAAVTNECVVFNQCNVNLSRLRLLWLYTGYGKIRINCKSASLLCLNQLRSCRVCYCHLRLEILNEILQIDVSTILLNWLLKSL